MNEKKQEGVDYRDNGACPYRDAKEDVYSDRGPNDFLDGIER